MRTHTRPGALYEIGRHRGAFVLWFLFLFFGSYLFLAAVDALPDPSGSVGDTTDGTNSASDTQPAVPGDAPVRVAAPAVGLDVRVNNPTSSDVNVLNEALLTGAARYPTSAVLGQEGTVLLFGHSSYLPIVHNQNYKAFDGIQNLKEGDLVSVYSSSHEYRYSVTSVKLMSAASDNVVLDATGTHLALVTCDSFGLKSDRFVVRADFLESVPLQ